MTGTYGLIKLQRISVSKDTITLQKRTLINYSAGKHIAVLLVLVVVRGEEAGVVALLDHDVRDLRLVVRGNLLLKIGSG